MLRVARRATFTAIVTATLLVTTSSSAWSSELDPRQATAEEYANIQTATAARDAMTPILTAMQAALAAEGNGNRLIPCEQAAALPSYALFVQATGRSVCGPPVATSSAAAATSIDLACSGTLTPHYIKDFIKFGPIPVIPVFTNMQLEYVINCYSPENIFVAIATGSGIVPGWPNLMAGAAELTGDGGWMSCDFYTSPSLEGVRPAILAYDAQVLASNRQVYYTYGAYAYS